MQVVAICISRRRTFGKSSPNICLRRGCRKEISIYIAFGRYCPSADFAFAFSIPTSRPFIAFLIRHRHIKPKHEFRTFCFVVNLIVIAGGHNTPKTAVARGLRGLRHIEMACRVLRIGIQIVGTACFRIDFDRIPLGTGCPRTVRGRGRLSEVLRIRKAAHEACHQGKQQSRSPVLFHFSVNLGVNIIIVCNCLIKKRKSILTNPLPQIITITLKHKFFRDKFSTLCLRLVTQNYCFLQNSNYETFAIFRSLCIFKFYPPLFAKSTFHFKV